MKSDITAAARISRRIANRIAGDSKESGVALLSAILFMIIMAGISTVIMGTVLGQVHPTYLSQKSTQTVYAAQSGMQAALSRFRAAVQLDGGGHPVTDTLGNPLGDPTKLPCSLAGNVDPTAPTNGVAYAVSIYYYTADPTDLATAAVPIPPGYLPCTTPGGVTSTSAAPVKFALVISKGTGNVLPGDVSTSTAGNRSLAAVYQFKVSTVNIVGGLINDYNSGGAYCLAAVSATSGSLIKFQPATSCIAANKALQLWIYDTDYEIKLASTTTNGAAGLCITGPPAANSSNPQNAILSPCLASPSALRWNQLWSWVGSNTWQGQQLIAPSGGTNWSLGTNNNAGANLNGLPLVVQNSGNNGGFSPSAAVGAGAASYGTHQMVNYLEFGRCADVTSGDINNSFMISYPCKQDPVNGGASLNWNHKWYYTEPAIQTPGPAYKLGPQQIVVNVDNQAPSADPSGNYCLYVASGTYAVGSIVKFTACSTTATQKIWTRVYNTGDYDASYKFTTPASSGGGTLCLSVDPTQLYLGWSKLILTTCTNSLAQKWNAPPTYAAGDVGGYKEIGG